MKNLIIIASICVALFSCNNSNSTSVEKNGEFEYFGEKINKDDAIAAADFLANFEEGDSIEMKITGEIASVCTKKGCWMTMDVNAEDNLMIRFKDYGFFVPLNADGRTATIEGWAYKEVLSVQELKHYAFDAGESDETIEAITEPEVSYSFMANGVIIE